MPTSPAQLVKNKPVATLTTAEAIAAFVLTYLVAHGTISADVAKTWGPILAIVLPAVFGAAKHALVSPAVKVRDVLEKDGLLTDADVGRLQALFGDVVHDAMGSSWLDQHATGEDHPDAVNVGTPPDQVRPADVQPTEEDPAAGLGGMAAGDPSLPVAPASP